MTIKKIWEPTIRESKGHDLNHLDQSMFANKHVAKKQLQKKVQHNKFQDTTSANCASTADISRPDLRGIVIPCHAFQKIAFTF